MLNKELLLITSSDKGVTVTLEALTNKFRAVIVDCTTLNYHKEFNSKEKDTIFNVPKGTQFEFSTDRGDVGILDHQGATIVHGLYPTLLEIDGDVDAYITFKSG